MILAAVRRFLLPLRTRPDAGGRLLWLWVAAGGLGFASFPTAPRPALADWDLYRWSWEESGVWEKLGQSRHLARCTGGPGVQATCGCRDRFDADLDGDVDLIDIAAFMRFVDQV